MEDSSLEDLMWTQVFITWTSTAQHWIAHGIWSGFDWLHSGRKGCFKISIGTIL